MPKTKIVCTIGPSSREEPVLREMIRAGMNVARINFSHGEHEEHGRNIALLRRLAGEENRLLAIIADLQGPKFRIGPIEDGQVLLESGKTITLTSRAVPGHPQEVNLPHAELIASMRPGNHILLDDGLLELEVMQVRGEDVECKVVTGGALKPHKGVSLIGGDLRLPAVTDKDRQDLAFAIGQGIDYIAQSFVRSPEDILTLRRAMADLGTSLPIIAKIEKAEALDNFDDILTISNGIMVARGDLGIETPLAKVPIHQKHLILKSNLAGKPVITATQMLDSMTWNMRPSRAEVSDVVNAVLDGTGAVMLSGETAVGKDPVNVVRTMARIAEVAEEEFPYESWVQEAARLRADTAMDAISQTANEIAQELGAAAIITPTRTGHTPRLIARYRPSPPIFATTPNEETCRGLALVWGVQAHLIAHCRSTDDIVRLSIEKATAALGLQAGAVVVITAGVPFGEHIGTNMVQVRTI